MTKPFPVSLPGCFVLLLHEWQRKCDFCSPTVSQRSFYICRAKWKKTSLGKMGWGLVSVKKMMEVITFWAKTDKKRRTQEVRSQSLAHLTSQHSWQLKAELIVNPAGVLQSRRLPHFIHLFTFKYVLKFYANKHSPSDLFVWKYYMIDLIKYTELTEIHHLFFF